MQGLELSSAIESRQARAWRDFACLGLASEVRDKGLGTNR